MAISEKPSDRIALSVLETASALGVSRVTVWRMMTSGELPSVRLSKRVRRIPVAALEKYMASRLEEAGEGVA